MLDEPLANMLKKIATKSNPLSEAASAIGGVGWSGDHDGKQ